MVLSIYKEGSYIMPFQIIHSDITKMNTDAIVNAANFRLQQGGGVCGVIFERAGEKRLQEECDAIGSCAVGHAVITKGYNLFARYIIHAVGPVWHGGKQGEDELLAMAYRNSLELAKRHNLVSISFPLISSGIFGYPRYEALQIANSVISEFLSHHEMDIYLAVVDRRMIMLNETVFTQINQYIEMFYEASDGYETSKQSIPNPNLFEFDQISDSNTQNIQTDSRLYEGEDYFKKPILSYPNKGNFRSLDDIVKQMDETFSEMVLRLIDDKGKKDTDIYKKANINRKLFSKIRINKDYQPKKSTALSLAISLELSMDETKDLLMKAGYTLSLSNRFDLIIRYFIENKNYDMFLINEALFIYDQPLLGA
jgi:O-acetyl-ADP-ribose deacetylase (regulator of RNase III)